jgi:hypothetical protein
LIGKPEKTTVVLDPDYESRQAEMEFKLTYEGLLKAATNNNNQVKHKHEIRKVFHKQLKRLFELHPAYEIVRPINKETIESDSYISASAHDADKQYQELIKRFERNGYKFLPLATRDLSLMCSINILFLRPDPPGGVIKSGDIDNRMKTIFDSLRMPSDGNELKGHETPDEGEVPFFCLLEDDSLISHPSIETDTLLQPTRSEWQNNDSRLVITVRLSPYRHTWGNTGFV